MDDDQDQVGFCGCEFGEAFGIGAAFELVVEAFCQGFTSRNERHASVRQGLVFEDHADSKGFVGTAFRHRIRPRHNVNRMTERCGAFA